MSAQWRRWLMGLMLMATLSSAWAGPRVLIVREDSNVSRQVAERLSRELERMAWSVGETIVGVGRPLTLRRENEQGKLILVALGGRVFSDVVQKAAGRPVVGAMIGRSMIDELPSLVGQRGSVILLDQPAERWAQLIQQAFPTRQTVGLLVGASGQKTAQFLDQNFKSRGIGIVIETATTTTDVIAALERLTPRMNLLLAFPDPLTHNRNTVQAVLLTTYRTGIPVLAYSEAYQQAGAVMALYSTVPQIVGQVVDTLRQLEEGMTPPASIQWPRDFTVGINSAVARSLGLNLPAASELQERLRGAER